jgi:hypothetical protein
MSAKSPFNEIKTEDSLLSLGDDHRIIRRPGYQDYIRGPGANQGKARVLEGFYPLAKVHFPVRTRGTKPFLFVAFISSESAQSA